MTKLFIGKLSFSTTESSLRDLFAEYEPLASVKIITDKLSGESRGFGFIEIDNSTSANAAIKALDGTTLDGKNIVVNEARPQSDGPRNYGGRSNYRGSNRNSYGSAGNSRY